ncbi:MAG: hypothetical protein ACFFBP_10335 [Promethearchaeota archaeon]
MQQIGHVIDGIYLEIKPMAHAYVFELKQQWKKFVGFSIISILIVFLQSFIMYSVIPSSLLPTTQIAYLSNGLELLSMFVLIFAACFFFSGIICTEYDKKTGYIIFPKINRFKLIVGKYFGNLTLIIGVVAVFYVTLGLFCWFYYGVSLNILYLISFGISILYLLAISSFVTFFSSFLRSVNITTITTIMILFIGFNIVDQLITVFLPDFEPIYSIQYASNLISSILEYPFSGARYTELGGFRGFSFRMWQTPLVEVGISVMLIYMILSLIAASILFKRRQL